MKRETRKAIDIVAAEAAEHFDGRRGGGDGPEDVFMRRVRLVAESALATDAEVKRLKKENEQMRATLEKIAAADPFTAPCVDARATLAALKPQVTRERKRR